MLPLQKDCSIMNTATTTKASTFQRVPQLAIPSATVMSKKERRAKILAETISPEEYFTRLNEAIDRLYAERTKA